jgi:5-(carboxyamino)imidazole ribonucleotide synthase
MTLFHVLAGNSDRLDLARPTRIGIIGGGQLGKMIAQEARRMSFNIIILDPSDGCPASGIADKQIVASFKDEDAIMKLAEESDVVTYEIELASSSALKRLESNRYPVRPSPETLRIIQNKYRQKSFLREHRVPVPEFGLVRSERELLELSVKFGFPSILKACDDSYDGRGNYVVRSKRDVSKAYGYFMGREVMLEEFVPFTKEISIMVARNPTGQIESFPVVENFHKNGILDTTVAPARISSRIELKAKRLAEKAMSVLQGAGIFGIEMFVTKNGNVLVNEIAPRPHNSGHYSNEACSISQFEQHLRAILNLRLEKPRLLSPAAMINLLGPAGWEGPYSVEGMNKLASVPGAKLYIYGKLTSKPQRKLGHITVTAETVEEALSRAKKARKSIQIVRSKEA